MSGFSKRSKPIQTSPPSMAQQRYTPSPVNNPNPASTAGQGIRNPAISNHANNTTGNFMQVQNSKPSQCSTNPPHVPLWVIFGVQDRSEFSNIENIEMLSPSMSDIVFFKELKRLENKHRWPFLRWLSPYIFSYCKFVRVSVLHY